MDFTHFNESGRAHMVEIGDKDITKRKAIATGKILMKQATIEKVKEGLIKKGDVLSVAQIAGIMGAKRTSDIIPMCHNIPLSSVEMDFEFKNDSIIIKAETKTTGKTGVEMESLTAVSIACLTIYDMCKAIDKDMEIMDIKLLEKTGGKSGEYKRIVPKVVSINQSKEKGTIKDPINEGVFIEEFGLKDDAHGGKWHRQVSLLDLSSFKKMEDLGVEDLTAGIFAENITTEGIELFSLPIGTILRIGETIQEVTQIGKECHSGCEIAKKVGKCIMPKEGIFTKIIKGGKIKNGDVIEIIG